MSGGSIQHLLPIVTLDCSGLEIASAFLSTPGQWIMGQGKPVACSWKVLVGIDRVRV